jgi:hypothetical protein
MDINAQGEDPVFLRESLRQTLEKALLQVASQPVTLEAYEIKYSKIKPKGETNLELELSLRWQGSGQRSTCLVSATLWPTMELGRRRFEKEAGQMVPIDFSGRLELAGFWRSMAFVPERATIVRVFPADPVLTGLVPATDSGKMMALVRDHMPDGLQSGCQPRDLRYEVLHYKPRRSCTLLYSVSLQHGSETDARSREIIGKVYSDERGRSCYELLKAVWEAACSSKGAWGAARPIAYVPSWRLVLQEVVPGWQFRHVFSELMREDAGEAELYQLQEHLEAIARAIRSFQTAPVRFGPRCDFGAFAASQEKSLACLWKRHPALAEELARLRERLMELEPKIPAAPLGLAHRDFGYGNVLVGDAGVSIIDFDCAGQAEPVHDVAHFLTQLSSIGLQERTRPEHLERLCASFREAYLRLAPEVPASRLALYEALALATDVGRNYRKHGHEASWLDWARAQAGAAWKRLEKAAP